MHHHLNTLYQGQSLTRDAARDAFSQVVRGEVDPIVLASLLTALKLKGRLRRRLLAQPRRCWPKRATSRVRITISVTSSAPGAMASTPSTSPPPRRWSPPPAA